MAAKKRKPEEQPSAPVWMLTFSDCMTNLLCFFVMLVTFSSFDDVELQKLAGVFECASSNFSIFPASRTPRDSALPPVPRAVHMTERGSEVPATTDNRTTVNPPALAPIVDDEAHRDRKAFFIPSQWLFWGNGTVLTEQGRNYLSAIGQFMRMLPGRVVIAELPEDAAAAGEELCMDRALAVMQFFTDQMKLPAGQFSLTARPTSVPPRLRGHRVVAVTLISRGLG